MINEIGMADAGSWTALPDERPRGRGPVSNHEPRHQHDRSAHADEKENKTNKDNNVVLEMLRGQRIERIANKGEFVRHP
jgi:hypothetical protein